MTMTRKFLKRCEIYKYYAKNRNCDLSEDAMNKMFIFETFGIGDISITGFNTTGKIPNGYAVGQKLSNITISMWLEDCEKLGWVKVIKALIESNDYPLWFLEETFRGYLNKKREFYHEHIKTIKFPELFK